MVELLLLAAALSADNFVVSIGYGSSNGIVHSCTELFSKKT